MLAEYHPFLTPGILQGNVSKIDKAQAMSKLFGYELEIKHKFKQLAAVTAVDTFDIGGWVANFTAYTVRERGLT